MWRALFVSLSRNRTMKERVMRWGFVWRAASRFVAGETLEDGLRAIRELEALGIRGILDHLGENVESETDANRATEDYLLALDRIERLGLGGGLARSSLPHLAVKPTHLGLDLGEAICERNLRQVVERAARAGTVVEIDMESSAYTERTLNLYRRLAYEYPNTRIAIQAYLYRSREDVERLIEEGIARIRLCKGAYQEPPHLAYPRKRDVDANFVRLMERLLSGEARGRGAYVAIATHDERIIQHALRRIAEEEVPREAFEFQMLYGIRRDLQVALARQGFTVRVYVPYGTEWYPYFMRRLGERPANVWFVVRNLLYA
ncbi:proline dehydrogenase family protein [Thermoflexus sp.]|uniref:proline dehydrogenase family protein n=1 Tax=Thermoflexus sp. TaxID=1969742 RepID=UPI0025D4F41A|nr:proline dehydrogenase family protein [Thermoflexus sp.]MCS6963978.1 proline dehydrogenase family protein [Thermoflexus sp.]MCX7691058.1 proline dehydrogenase family protein [Thermoflexus sp.]MDW8185330.1 proline dehydrogenase family protein [Anaerolineae bacterium]